MASGLDAVTSAILGARIDSLVGGATAGGSATTTNTGTARATAAPGVLGGSAGAAKSTGPVSSESAEISLSEVAVALDAISRVGGDSPEPVQGQLPLWSTAPQTMAALASAALSASSASAAASTPGKSTRAATADANQAAATASAAIEAADDPNIIDMPASGDAQDWGSLPAGASASANPNDPASGANQTAGAGANPSGASGGSASSRAAQGAASAAATAAANAATTLAQLDSSLPSSMAMALSQALETSGLFYESHLAQWLTGSRALSELAREPQAQIASQQLPLQFQISDVDLLDNSTNPRASTANSASTAPGMLDINPAILPLVRQQLDMLGNPQPQFRWSGEAWPDAQLNWQVEALNAGNGADPASHTWRTRISIDLPGLGPVDAEMVLVGHQLVTRVRASAEGSASLQRDSEAFRRSIAATGLDMIQLVIKEARREPAQDPLPFVSHPASEASSYRAGNPAESAS